MSDYEPRIESAIAVVLDRTRRCFGFQKTLRQLTSWAIIFKTPGWSGAILGVRYLPLPDAVVVLRGISQGEGLRFAQDGQLRVLLMFWEQDQDFDPDAVDRRRSQRACLSGDKVDISSPLVAIAA